MQANDRRGILFAVLSYLSFGFLSPVGQILLDKGLAPFTLNAIRTILALPLLALLFGPKVTKAAGRAVATQRSVWILGAFWLSLTFVPYLWSLKYLPPTITTLTVYATPLIVAAWQRFRYGERVSKLVVPAVALTVVGAALAIQGPGGVTLDREGLLGLGLAFLGIVGWSGYTIHLGRLAPKSDPNVLTLAAFVTSAAAFTLGAILFERPLQAVDPSAYPYLALYVVFPGAAALWLYAQSLRRTDPTTVAVLIGIELVATAIVSRFMTDEVFSGLKVLGLAIVLVAITGYLWGERRRALAASNG